MMAICIRTLYLDEKEYKKQLELIFQHKERVYALDTTLNRTLISIYFEC